MENNLRRRTDDESAETMSLRALVVDDQEAYRRYVTTLLTRCGFDVTERADGAEALAELHSSNSYHLLVVDCEMPRLNGLQLISAVREMESRGAVYAIMLTGRETVDVKVKALRRGFDDFIAKTASEDEITAKLTAAKRLVSRQKELDDTVRELYGLATRDELTGLFNRRFFFVEAERLLATGEAVNLVFFDLDNFKRVNDTHGHLAGDRILRDIGALFLHRTRTEDLIARYGGDEFVMLVPKLEPSAVEHLAERISAEIGAAQWTFSTETLTVGVTTGISCSSLLDEPTVAKLLTVGDRDLYKNKWVRKNPHEDPKLYEYDEKRESRVIELVKDASVPKAASEEA